MVHVFHQREHFVLLPVPNVKCWFFQVVDSFLSEDVLGIVSDASAS